MSCTVRASLDPHRMSENAGHSRYLSRRAINVHREKVILRSPSTLLGCGKWSTEFGGDSAFNYVDFMLYIEFKCHCPICLRQRAFLPSSVQTNTCKIVDLTCFHQSSYGIREYIRNVLCTCCVCCPSIICTIGACQGSLGSKSTS